MKYIINGGVPARGTVRISGAKNFSVKALALSLLQNSEIEYANVPDNLDVFKTLSMLGSIGAQTEFDSYRKKCKVNVANVSNKLKDAANANMITYLIGAGLIHKFDLVHFPKPAGCGLGMRADDFHIMAFENFGVKCEVEENEYVLTKSAKLKACDIVLPYPSVGATETALFLAVKAEGITRIFNAAIEPEVNALVTAMVSMGAKIFWIGDRDIIVHGVDELSNHTKIEIHGDYLEAASWAVLAAATKGDITVEGVVPELIGSFLGIFTLLGGAMERLDHDKIRFYSKDIIRAESNDHIMIETGVFPKLRTDLQPMLAVLASVNNLKAIVHDTVYDSRVGYMETFKKFGIRTELTHECFDNNCRFHEDSWGKKSMHSGIINGRADELTAPTEEIEATTIRSGMAEIILAAASKGRAIINKVELVERGYCSLVEKLKQVGVQIEYLD